MKRRFLSLLLALVMLLGMLPVSGLANSQEEFIDKSAHEEFVKNYAESLENDDDQLHSFIVEVKTEGRRSLFRSASSQSSNQAMISSFQSAKASGDLDSYVSSREEEQDKVISQVFNSQSNKRSSLFRSASTSITNRPLDQDMVRLKTVMNGFSAELSYKEAEEVAKLNGVEGVYLVHEYNRPETNQEPSMAYSRDLVNSSEANARGYDGRGRLIAILDTGADVSHPDLVLSEEGKSAAMYNEATINKKIEELQLLGTYRTPKIPYAYNYADREQEILDNANHGQHIAGTIAGNGQVKGIVPEAQLLVMRVFGLGAPTTNTKIYAEAIDDAVLLGADSINMSLGSYAGTQSQADLIMTKVIANANAQGTIVTIAGGNDGYQMSGYKNQDENLLDFSTVGTPATIKESLAVASFNNLKVRETHSLKLAGSDERITIYPGSGVANSKENEFKYNTDYDFVSVGLGNTDQDYAGKDLTGKIALAQRGEASFTDKAKMAEKHGAIALLIGDNQDTTGRFTMTMDANLIKSFYLRKSDYEAIKDLTTKIQIKDDIYYGESGNASTMSNFNSWGPTPELKIKPEIAAPGGDIYSTDNEAGYTYMSGTSMATPHVAGGIGAVNKFVEEHITKDKSKIADYTRNILMATAIPQEIKGQPGKYYMVRSQGAGLMNLDYATRSNQVLVRDNGNNSSKGDAKIELGEIKGNSFDISLALENLSNKSVKYDVYYVLQTDLIKDGKFVLDMSNYDLVTIDKKTKIGEIGLDSKGKTEFNHTIEFNDTYVEKANYYLDGFVFLEPVVEEGAEKEFSPLSVPFLGFKGDWYKQPIIEKYLDEFDLENGELPYFARELIAPIPGLKGYPQNFGMVDIPATYFYSQINDLITGRIGTDILGRKWDGSFTDKYAISPNGDTNQDSMSFSGVFLRNYEDFRIKIFDENNVQVNEVYNIYRASGRKSAFTINMRNPISANIQTIWTWDGSDYQGNTLPEGVYNLVLSSKLAGSKNAYQELKREVIIDNTKPSIDSIKDEENQVLLEVKDHGQTPSGIKAVLYLQEDIEVLKELKEVNGKYILDKAGIEGLNLEEGKFIALDWAGNRIDRNINDDLGTGKVNFTRYLKADENTEKVLGGPANEIAVYRIDGEEKTRVEDLNKLSKGSYIAELVDEPANYKIEWLDSNEFDITEDNQEVNIDVIFTKIDTNKYGKLSVNLVWPGDYDGQIKLYARPVLDGSANNSEEVQGHILTKEITFGNSIYSVKLPAGEYEVYALNQAGEEVQLTGPKKVLVKSQETTSISLQYSYTMGYIKVVLVSFGIDIDKYFEEKGAYTQAKDRDGLDAKIFNDLSEYMDIVNTNTGESLFDTEANYFGQERPENAFVTWTGVGLGYAMRIEIPAPFGNYRLEWKNTDGIISTPGSFEHRPSAWGEDQDGAGNDTSKYLLLSDKSSVNGSLVIKETMIPGAKGQPAGLYSLVDSFGNEIEALEINKWTNLPVGNYTLHVESANQEVKPEKKSYNISIVDSEEVEVEVRWMDNAARPGNREGELVLSVHSDSEVVDLKDIKVRLINQTNPDLKEIVGEFQADQSLRLLVPLGDYKIVVENLDGYEIKDIYLSVDGYSNRRDLVRDNNTTFDMPIYEYWNEVEIRLAKEERALGEIQITEIADSQDFAGAIYQLDNPIYGVRYGRDLQALFNKVEAGDYTLTITPPTGYKVNGESVIDIKVIANQVTRLEVQFTIDPDQSAKLNIVGRLEDGQGYPVNFMDVDFSIENVEITDKDGASVDKNNLPLNQELIVKPVYNGKFELLDSQEKNIILRDEISNLIFRFKAEDADLYELEGEEVTVSNLMTEKEIKDKIIKSIKFSKSTPYPLGKAMPKITVDNYDNGTVEAIITFPDDTITRINFPIIMEKYFKLDITNGSSDKEFYKEGERVIIRPNIPKGKKIKMISTEPMVELEAIESGYELKMPGFDLNVNIVLEDKVIEKPIIIKPDHGSIRIPDTKPVEPDYDWIRAINEKAPIKKLIKEEVVVEERKPEIIIKATKADQLVAVTDIMASKYEKEIIEVLARGLMAGVGENKFDPETGITRAMVVQVLMNMTENVSVEASSSKFTDVKVDDWFFKAVHWAEELGLVVGVGEGKFEPNRTINLQELSIVIKNYLEKAELDLPIVNELGLKDTSKIADWALESVEYIHTIGLFQLEEPVDGKQVLTRADLARALYVIANGAEK